AGMAVLSDGHAVFDATDPADKKAQTCAIVSSWEPKDGRRSWPGSTLMLCWHWRSGGPNSHAGWRQPCLSSKGGGSRVSCFSFSTEPSDSASSSASCPV